jgi:hypothetical protein
VNGSSVQHWQAEREILEKANAQQKREITQLKAKVIELEHDGSRREENFERGKI